MLRLYVLRHAKSSWAVPGASDFERELSARGISDLLKIATAIEHHNYQPAQILCSPAARTKQTLEQLRPAFAAEPQIAYPQKLYSSGVNEYLELLQGLDNPSPAMIIGHNPMCGSLVAMLSGTGKPEALSIINLKYPTCALAVIDFDLPQWSDVNRAKGFLRECMLPKALTS